MAKIRIQETPIADLLVIEPQVFLDQRGYFLESFNRKAFKEAGLAVEFVQDNMSRSARGVLRGLHFCCPFSKAWNYLLRMKLRMKAKGVIVYEVSYYR